MLNSPQILHFICKWGFTHQSSEEQVLKKMKGLCKALRQDLDLPYYLIILITEFDHVNKGFFKMGRGL